MNVVYQNRDFVVPEDFVLLDIPTGIYTDAQIDNLYTRFSCCYADRISKFIEAKKKGDKSCIDRKTKYLLMALYVLRNWYNPAVVFSYPLVYNPSGGSGSNYNSALFLVTSDGGTSVANPILSTYLVEADTQEDLLSAMIAALPVGYTASLSLDGNSMIIKNYNPNPNFGWVYVQEHSVGGFPDIDQFWFPNTLSQICISPIQIQKIIQNCLKICGCQCCTNISDMEKDYIYVPVGQPQPKIITGVSELTAPITYWN